MRKPDVVLDLSQRLTDSQTSLAWAHLYSSPLGPIPQELKHLTEPEWYLLGDLLDHNLKLRELLPLQ